MWFARIARIARRGGRKGVDVLRVALRWLHAVAAVAWIGGSLFYLVVLNPAFASSPPDPSSRTLRARINATFRDLVQASVVVFALTGVVLLYDQLSRPGITLAYTLVLGAHGALPVAMFLLVQRLGRARPAPSAGGSPAAWWRQPQILLLILGLLTYLTAIVMQVMYEGILAGSGGSG